MSVKNASPKYMHRRNSWRFLWRVEGINVCAYVAVGGGFAVAHLVEALRYKLECCGFDSRWGCGDFSFA